ncbi:MAG TPA: hypothetical protein VMQ51_18095 [Candidatus Binatia bacterium]|nr:hypothetical protein [Candidatus Binatia bacterium]
MSEADRSRLVACRACGNRVAREARRCPACGTHEPTVAAADAPVAPSPDQLDLIAVPPAPRPATPVAPPVGSVFTAPGPPRAGAGPSPPRRAARRRRRAMVAALGVLFALTAAGVTAVYVTMPPLSSRPSPPEVSPPPVAATPAPSAGPIATSRSRGRSDWLFFFKPGDWLARMADDALLGVVVRLEKTHTFADGSRGPAYVVQSMEGEERVLDADELERTARLR